MTLDDALDELYGAPLEDFVAERRRLAKMLEGDDATRLAKLRKPTAAAWALNQLARRERRDVDLLLDAGHRLRQAAVEKDAFGRARAKEAEALRRLAKAAERLGLSAPNVARVESALRAAAVTEEGRELLARGRFVELPQATGFEAYEGVELPRPPARPRTEKPPRPRVSEEETAARAALRAAELKLRRAAAEVEAARRRLERLQGSEAEPD